jgi:hypothetical protein
MPEGTGTLAVLYAHQDEHLFSLERIAAICSLVLIVKFTGLKKLYFRGCSKAVFWSHYRMFLGLLVINCKDPLWIRILPSTSKK